MEYITINAVGKDFQFLRIFGKEKHSELCIYGCGVNGEIILNYLRKLGVEIAFFVDRQAKDREFEVLGKKVISPSTYLKKYINNTIIISPDNYGMIVQNLVENGVDRKKIIVPFRKVEKEIRVLDESYIPKIEKSIGYIEKRISAVGKKATFFSIVYNTPNWMLCRTIESILNQSYENWKYFIIDNGSTDSSSEIIKAYAEADNRISYIRFEKNVVWTDRRLLTVLKEGIKSDYVAMIDSDDYYEPSFLESTLTLAEKWKADMVQVNTLTYAHAGFRYSYCTHFWGEDMCVEGKEKEYIFMQRILFVPVWGKLYETKLFMKLIEKMLLYDSEYDRDRNFCLDISWITYMALECRRAVLCDDILHIRTWRPGSSEHTDAHSSKWLSSIIWSFEHLRRMGISYEDSRVFEEAQLMWLFNLPRENVELSVFREKDLNNKRVKEFLLRPLCDRYVNRNLKER